MHFSWACFGDKVAELLSVHAPNFSKYFWAVAPVAKLDVMVFVISWEPPEGYHFSFMPPKWVGDFLGKLPGGRWGLKVGHKKDDFLKNILFIYFACARY